jgi:hypothetical protein
MSSNVVCLTTRKSERAEETVKESAADEFVRQFYDWAAQHGIDTTTTNFKYDAATVLTVVQSILHERD